MFYIILVLFIIILLLDIYYLAKKIQTFQLGDDNGNVIGITGELKK